MSKPAAAETLLKALERWQALVEDRAWDEGRVAADEQQRRAAERQRFTHAQRKQREEADRELAEIGRAHV